MKSLFFLPLVLTLSLIFPRELFPQEPTQPLESSLLLGTFDSDSLKAEPHRSWFTTEYEAYILQQELLDSLRAWWTDVTIDIYLGTWCSDSRREVPRILKILDHLGTPTEHLRMVGLDRKKASPGQEEEGMNIHHVPTFIFYLDQVEIGRIIETPIETL